MQLPEFDPLLFLQLADELATADADEATLRTAVGRAYYAVFLLARSKVGVHGRHNIHERVRQTISPVNSRAASLLGSIAYVRFVADYELQPNNPRYRNWRRNWERVRNDVVNVLDELSTLPDLVLDPTDEQP